MIAWGHSINTSKINQWHTWQRVFLLFVLLSTLSVAWYFFLEKPLLENNQVVLQQQAHDEALAKELSTFLGLRANFVYKNALQSVQIKPVFQNATSGTVGLTMTSYVDNPVTTLPAGANQFAGLKTVLPVSLLNIIQRSSATLVFSSEFNNFVAYLRILERNSQGIYFDSIDFNMNRYPKAEITLKVFTLEGAQ